MNTDHSLKSYSQIIFNKLLIQECRGYNDLVYYSVYTIVFYTVKDIYSASARFVVFCVQFP